MNSDKLIIIYDFDGTLTPYSSPQYEILKELGYDDEHMGLLVKNFIDKGYDLYDSYMKALYYIFKQFNIDMNLDAFYKGANNTQFNLGVLDYFKKYNLDNIKNYVVTSGFKDYICKTKIGDYLDGIYGITVDNSGNEFKVLSLMKDVDKVKAIDEIKKINNCEFSDIIYFGDGLTDKYAFEHVHNNGGTSIFINGADNKNNYCKLEDKNIIDLCFNNDFSDDSEVNKYIDKRIKNIS